MTNDEKPVADVPKDSEHKRCEWCKRMAVPAVKISATHLPAQRDLYYCSIKCENEADD